MLLRRSESEKEQQVDPRVKVELERLNSATDDINKLEVELDLAESLWLHVALRMPEWAKVLGQLTKVWRMSRLVLLPLQPLDIDARAAFHKMLRQSMVETEALCTRIGPSAVEKARPYYAARIQAKQAQTEAQSAAIRLEKANSAHSAAKEMVFLAEEGLTMEGRTFDHAWQEMLNHATIRVNECEKERTQSEAHNLRAAAACQVAQNKVTQLQKELKKPIAKSRCYYETKAKLNGRLEAQKAKIILLENLVFSAKTTYADALKNLETISNEIHKLRKGTNKLSTNKTGSHNGSSSTTSSESTGSPDSYPNEEYLRLPDRLDVSPSPQVDYRKLCGSEETSPIETRRCHISPLEQSPFESPSSVGSTFYPCPSELSTKGPEPLADEEWSEIPLSVDGVAPGVIDPVNAKEPDPVASNPPMEQIGRRQSIDALISGSTGKVKEMFSQGIMKLNIASISERKNSLESCRRRVGNRQRPSSRTSRCSTDEGGSSNEDPQSSDEMLSDEQIASLMLDEELQQGSSSTSKTNLL